MAMSFTRPDPSSPAAVADASFGTVRRGFDQSEVRDFLRMVAAELGRLQERERFLERELRASQSDPDLSSVQLDDEALTRLLGEETARVLTTARESAVEIRQKAEQSASQLLSEASDEAARVREEAEIEASRRRSDAAADAEAELSMAKQQGREMVNEARAYRERVLSELARRRELAREQIEQLLHGRDRLMQSFERARLVAVDVVADLQPLGEPDEYVNLAPTTGPVPVMVPNTARPGTPDGRDASSRTDEPITAAAAGERATARAGDEGDVVDTDRDLTDDEVTEAAGAGPVADHGESMPDGDKATIVEGAAADAAGPDGAVDMADGPAGPDALDEADGPEAVDAPDMAETADASETADTVDVDASVVDDEFDIASVEGAETSAASDVSDEVVGDAPDGEAPRDDVVVDLFARLRADTGGESSEEEPGAASNDGTPDDEAIDDVAAEVAPLAAPGSVDAIQSAEEIEPSEDADSTPFQQRDANLTPLIVSSARRIKRVLADEQNEALEALRRNEPVRSIDDLLPTSDGHLQRYRSAIADDLRDAANAGAAAVGTSGPLRKADAAKAVAAADAVLDEWITLPLRERLERGVADGDGDNTSIAKTVRAVYREWKTQHIDEQLDDVLRAAHGRGAFAAIKRGTPVVWVADPHHQACADCDDNTLAGAVVIGDEFPTGHVFAPAHLGCRCLLLPADR